MKINSEILALPESIEIEVLEDFDSYTEGPVIDSNGDLFFTDLVGKSIWLWSGQKATRWSSGSRPNGQAIMKNGHHLICDSAEGCIVEYNEKGGIENKLGAGNIGHLRVQCPNDIVIDPEHGFYFTDSVRCDGAVFFVGFDGKKSVVADQIDFANGIVLSADGQHLYVAESYRNRILCITLDEPGVRKGRVEVFADLPFNSKNPETGNLPDGLALDAFGRLWVAHYGMEAVQILSTAGEVMMSYHTGIPLTSNLCFWGSDLIVTGGFGEPGPGRVSRLMVRSNT